MDLSITLDLQRLAAAQEDGLAQQERSRLRFPYGTQRKAACPICGQQLEAERQLAYTLRGAARDKCLGCEICLGPLEAEQTPGTLRCTAWEAEELWY